MDKLTLKRLFAQAGIPQVDFVAAGEPGWRERCDATGPAALGQALAARLQRRHQQGRQASGSELDEAVELARRHDPRVIVEASAAGREVECSLLGNEEVEASLPGEVVANGEWYDYETKYREGGMELVVPAPIAEPSSSPGSASWPSTAFELAGCSGLARCDFFVEPDGAVLVNEINTMPGFTETSVYAKLWEACGLAYPDSATASSRSPSSATRRAPTSSEPARSEPPGRP